MWSAGPMARIDLACDAIQRSYVLRQEVYRSFNGRAWSVHNLHTSPSRLALRSLEFNGWIEKWKK